MDRYGNLAAEARKGFVDRVVDDLEYHVVEAGSVIGIADVHPGPFANGFKALQDLDIPRSVFVVGHAQPRKG